MPACKRTQDSCILMGYIPTLGMIVSILTKGNYEEPGAYQGEESKYYDWYDFNEDGTYKSWWGFETLPEVNELNEKFVDYIITGEDSVIEALVKTWSIRIPSGCCRRTSR